MGTLGSCSSRPGTRPRSVPELPSLRVLLASHQERRFLSSGEGERRPALRELGRLAASCGQDGAVAMAADTRAEAEQRRQERRPVSLGLAPTAPPTHPAWGPSASGGLSGASAFSVLCTRQVSSVLRKGRGDAQEPQSPWVLTSTGDPSPQGLRAGVVAAWPRFLGCPGLCPLPSVLVAPFRQGRGQSLSHHLPARPPWPVCALTPRTAGSSAKEAGSAPLLWARRTEFCQVPRRTSRP